MKESKDVDTEYWSQIISIAAVSVIYPVTDWVKLGCFYRADVLLAGVFLVFFFIFLEFVDGNENKNLEYPQT